jgi:hypothetical protein
LLTATSIGRSGVRYDPLRPATPDPHGAQSFRHAHALIEPELLDELNRVHHAARQGRTLPPAERARVFQCALMFEQERTVGPKIREEVGKFDCPILSAIVLRPMVRFSYFPRTTYLAFSNFGNTEERIEKALCSYDLAEQAGWRRVGV